MRKPGKVPMIKEGNGRMEGSRGREDGGRGKGRREERRKEYWITCGKLG